MSIKDWLMEFICNSLLVGMIKIFYYIIYQRKKEKYYADKAEVRERIVALINMFIDIILPCFIIIMINNTDFFILGLFFGCKSEILKKWEKICLLVIMELLWKGVLIAFQKRGWRVPFKEPHSIGNMLIELYEESELFDKYFIKEKYSSLVKSIIFLEAGYILYFLGNYNVVEALEIGATAAIYPILILMIFAELRTSLCGYTEEEYCKNVLHCNIEKIKNPGVVAISDNMIQQLKPFKLLVKSEYFEDDGKEEKPSYYENDYEYTLFYEFINNKNYYEKKQNLDYFIAPTVYLLKKQNVVFNTYFYRDLDIALFFPMMLSSFKGKKSLMVIDNADYEDEAKWVTESIERMCGIFDCAKCNYIQEARNDDDIIILDYNQLFHWYESPLLKRISSRIDMIFLVEPSLHTAQELKELYGFKRFIEEKGENVNVVIADSRQEIVERMMWASDSETMYKGPYRLIPKKYTVILWDADSMENWEFTNEEIEVNIIRILKENMEKGEIIWINQNVRPSVDLWWQFQKNQMLPERIELIHLENGRELTASKDAYYIIEDTDYNYLTIEDRFLSRAEEKGIVCIMEPNYMLRNYLLLNKDIRKNILEGIRTKIISEVLLSERNDIIELICRLCIEDIKLKDIDMELSGDLDEEKLAYLNSEIEKYLSFLKLDLKNYYNKKERKIISLFSDEKVKEIVDKRKDLFIYRENQKIKVWNNMNYFLLYQKYLPGQNIIIKGRCYTFLNLEIQNGVYIVKVQRTLDNIGKREYYRQKRKYYLQMGTEIDSEYNLGNIKINRQKAYIECNTEGYIKMPRFQDFYNGKLIKKFGIPKRKYDNKQILSIEIGGINSVEQMYFAIILKEILYTLCPEHIDYLGICIPFLGNENDLQKWYLERGIIWEVEAPVNKVYIIEDHIQDLGILEAIELRMEFILELMLSYIDWYLTSEDTYLLFGINASEEELKNHLIELKRKMEDTTSQIESNENIQGENLEEYVLSKKYGTEIFEEVLIDMFWFRDLNINLALQPVFYKGKRKRKENKERKGYVYLNLAVSRKEFYKNCAYGIIEEYNIISQKGMKKEQCEEYARDYVELLFK